MSKGRLEAFSDGVMAIIITIMVLELAPPHGSELSDLLPLLPKIFSYILSFVLLGTYWNNHHHLWQAVERVSGSVLWANLHVFFWLSLVPFATAWMGENNFDVIPVALYGVVLLLAGFAYYLMVRELVKHHDLDSALARAVSDNTKEMISVGLYVAAIPLAFVSQWISVSIYVICLVIWLIPDKRIEEVMSGN